MKTLLLLPLAALLFLVSCSKHDEVISVAASITTTTVSGISSTEATSGGNITSAGSAPVTARGIVWSINPNPTIDLATKTSNGSGAGTFTSSITGLQANTTYHVRAYATSSAGTAYGNDISFVTSAPIPKLYVCGTEWNTALSKQQCKIWIDGTGTFWGGSDETFGTGLFVSDAGDIYVSGAAKVTQWRATYWKNGTPVYLTDASYEAGAGAIFVNGSDVYVSGTERNATGVLIAKYWKNGTAVSLTNGTLDAEARSITVSGSDVYVSGYEKNSSGIKVAKYWKNGTVTTIGAGGVANSIFVSGADVHIAGTYNASSDRGWYWKNSSLADLNNGYGANNLFVTTSDVYVAGFDNSYEAAYWKNGTIVNLSGGFAANSIFVSGTDVYVAGVSPANNPCYWKNGTRTRLSASTDSHNNATGIIYK